ncbi:CatA-like O-acetyltransferase [Agromyces sp. NPDC057679]|uniref:CatA-like O-acetyltransferase n=1 Tax=Agromyces sp. NPDC057679 TaxID=3346207 RepID=UPI00366CD36F
MPTPSPTPIDLDSWPRREAFEHYRHRVPCTYAMTVELDVTAFVAALRGSARKTYPAQIWAIANVVNRHPEFRMTLTDDGAAATWPVVNPAFTVFNPERETFAAVSVPYDADFGRFHEAAVAELATASTATEMFPQGGLPANVFDVSSIPWTSFTGFTLQIDGGSNHFAPIFTLGRYLDRDGRTLLPLAVQIHHASADGFHTARLVGELEQLFADPAWVTA